MTVLTIAGGVLVALVVCVGVVLVLRFIMGLIFGVGGSDDD